MTTTRALPRPSRPTLPCLLLGLAVAAGLAAAARPAAAQATSTNARIRVEQTGDRLAVFGAGSGRDTQPLYTLPADLDHVVVSADGRYAASCRYGSRGGLRPKDPVISVYRDGYPYRTVTLDEVLERPKRVRTGGRQLAWGECLGFADDQHLELTTIENRRSFLDVAGGLWHRALRAVGIDASTAAPPPTESRAEDTPYDPCGVPHLLCDRFDSEVPGWRQFHGRWERDNGIVTQRSQLEREGNALMYFGNLSIADAEVEVVLRMEFTAPLIEIQEDNPRFRRLRQIAGAGVVFRLRDENNFYMFRLAGEQGAVLGKMVDGEWTDLATPRAADYLNEPLRYGQFYRLRVVVEEDRIQCWITELSKEGDRIKGREQAVINYRDDTFTTGYAGLVTFQVGAVFDNFRVIER